MISQQITTSAALYFDSKDGQSIPLLWFERASQLFEEHGLSPILFTASGGGFLLDDCCVFADRGADLVKFGQTIPARGAELINALRSSDVRSLVLDSPRPGADDREDWRATTSVLRSFGSLYIGIAKEFVADPRTLLHRAYEIANGLFGIAYGICYSSPLNSHPDSYAIGSTPLTLKTFREKFLPRTYRKSADELWRDELNGQRRHLLTAAL